MTRFISTTVALLVIFCCAAAAAVVVSADDFKPKLAPMSSPPRLVYSHNNSKLYTVTVPGYTDGPFYIANLSSSSRFGLGYDWGFMLANNSLDVFNALMSKVFGPNKLAKDVFTVFALIQFDLFVYKSLPVEHQQELDGIKQAFVDVGLGENKDMVNIAAVLASFPGSIHSNLKWLILDELHLGPNHFDLLERKKKLHREILLRHSEQHGTNTADMMDEKKKKDIIRSYIFNVLQKSATSFKRACSHFGVWGSRTEGGELFTGRNLDWLAQSGISRNKLLTVVHPPEPGLHSSVMVGFAGFWGAITGFSSKGVTVHESGDDNKMETLEGFMWAIRLRYVMERAQTMQEVLALWNSTKSTMGINHGVGVAQSKKYVALETMATYTAYFFDNDPREANLKISKSKATPCPWKNGNHPCDHVGFPLPEAVWRTNHAYDPKWLNTSVDCWPGTNINTITNKTEFSCVNALADTFTRYMLLHDTFKLYENTKTPIGFEQAVNLTAIVGDKGGANPDYERFVTCPAGKSGSNVVSAAFDPTNLQMYVAFENGMGSTHSVAACNYYGLFDLKNFL